MQIGRDWADACNANEEESGEHAPTIQVVRVETGTK